MENVMSLLRDTEIVSLGESRIDILIFKTNVINEHDVQKIAPVLDEDHRIEKWSIDLDDVDRVLRIESQQLQHSEVIAHISAVGYSCEELID